MNFDHIIMNAPYLRNLHLKILSEAMRHVKEEGGEIINLSPIRWLQDPLAEYKRGSDWKKFENVRRHISSLTNLGNCDDLFNIQCGDLGIYYCKGEEVEKAYEYPFAGKSIVEKILKHKDYISDHIENIETYDKELSVQVMEVYGGDPMTGSGFIKPIGYEAKKSSTNNGGKASRRGVIFATKEEAKNFYEASRTKLYIWMAYNFKSGTHYSYGKYFPFLPTYKTKWTDHQLYEYFGLNEEEIAIIEEEMK